MEQVFYFVLESLKAFFESEFSKYIMLGVVAILLFCFLVELLLSVVLKKGVGVEFFKSVSVISIITSILFSVGFIDSGVFEVLYYNLTLILLAYLMNLILKSVGKFFIKKQAEVEKSHNVEPVILPPTNVKRIVETIQCKTANSSEYSGYLNIDYLKELINKLKENNLTGEDLNEIEELEVYLLNFVTRQPVGKERQILSNYIGLLFKKLAKYNVVNE